MAPEKRAIGEPRTVIRSFFLFISFTFNGAEEFRRRSQWGGKEGRLKSASKADLSWRGRGNQIFPI